MPGRGPIRRTFVGIGLSRASVEAGDGARTHDPQLGKLMLYQLSYAREARIVATSRGAPRAQRALGARIGESRRNPQMAQ
jgi:hypothetical protein